MSRSNPRDLRILAVAPSTRGFGFAVLEGDTLLDWGVKSVKGDKNHQSLSKLNELVGYYQPGVLVLEDHTGKGLRRAARIRALNNEIIALAKNRGITLKMFSRQQVRKVYFADGKGTKHAVAEILAKRFTEELGCRLPKKRRPWMSEAYQMGIFDAVALAEAFRHRSLVL